MNSFISSEYLCNRLLVLARSTLNPIVREQAISQILHILPSLEAKAFEAMREGVSEFCLEIFAKEDDEQVLIFTGFLLDLKGFEGSAPMVKVWQ